MIDLKHVCSGYGAEELLHDITLSIPKQSITAVIGPNGCGKSTLLRTICGLLKPANGEILLDSLPQSQYSQNALARTVSFLPQHRSASSIRAETLVLHGRFPYMGYPRHYREEDRKAAREAMEWTGVSHLRSRNMSTLSGGEQQKVYIAMLLAQGTPIVLMDEPTTYLDISHKFDVIHLVQEMKRSGKTIVMVLHDLDLALKYADQVVLMDHGQITACGTPETVFASGKIEKTFSVHPGKMETDQGVQYYFYP